MVMDRRDDRTAWVGSFTKCLAAGVPLLCLAERSNSDTNLDNTCHAADLDSKPKYNDEIQNTLDDFNVS